MFLHHRRNIAEYTGGVIPLPYKNKRVGEGYYPSRNIYCNREKREG